MRTMVKAQLYAGLDSEFCYSIYFYDPSQKDWYLHRTYPTAEEAMKEAQELSKIELPTIHFQDGTEVHPEHPVPSLVTPKNACVDTAGKGIA